MGKSAHPQNGGFSFVITWKIIFAAALTRLAQWLKKYFPNEYVTIFAVLGISVAAAGIYTALVDANFWVSTVQIFTIAGAIYTYLIQRFEGPDETTTLSTSDLG